MLSLFFVSSCTLALCFSQLSHRWGAREGNCAKDGVVTAALIVVWKVKRAACHGKKLHLSIPLFCTTIQGTGATSCFASGHYPCNLPTDKGSSIWLTFCLLTSAFVFAALSVCISFLPFFSLSLKRSFLWWTPPFPQQCFREVTALKKLLFCRCSTSQWKKIGHCRWGFPVEHSQGGRGEDSAKCLMRCWGLHECSFASIS